MATMILGDIEEFGTEGEEAFYKFLEGWPSRMRTTSAGTRLTSTETNLIFYSTANHAGVQAYTI
jgi:hypothetical protein